MAEKLKGKELIKLGIKKERLKKKLGYQCVYCGCNNKLVLTIDHIIPITRDGKDEDTNKQVTCYICNQLKGGLTDNEFRKYYKLIQGLKDLQKIKLEIEQPNLIFRPNYFPQKDKETEDWWKEKNNPSK